MYLRNLIAHGEGQELDFKFQIISASKIAKTLVAFANSGGGRLLIGVKDNGNIVGIESDEEIYMIQLAAKSYCKPEVIVDLTEWEQDGKTVLEVYVPPSDEKPHFAREDNGKWLAYVRRDDENLLADKVLVEVFKRQKNNKESLIRYNKPVKILLNFLAEHDGITFSEFCELAKIPPFVAERILISLASVDIIEVNITSKANFFSLKLKAS